MPAYLYTERKKSWLKQDYKLLNKALGISRIPFWGEVKLLLVQEKGVELIGYVMHIIWHLNIADKACGKRDVIFFMCRTHHGIEVGSIIPQAGEAGPPAQWLLLLRLLAVHSDNSDRLTVQLETNTGFRQRSNPHIFVHSSCIFCGLLSFQANLLIYLTLGSRVGWNGGWHLKVYNRLILRSMMPFIVVNHGGRGYMSQTKSQ